MAQAHADRNLLFGILALQMDFIGRDALVRAMNAWVLDKHKPLGEILVAQNTLAPDVRATLELLVDKHLECHQNQPQHSLAALSLHPQVRRDLDRIADTEVHASLASLSTDHPNLIPSLPPGPPTELMGPQQAGGAVGESTSSGLRFAVLRPYAEGGLGKVSLARDRELNREVALKEIKPGYADDAEARSRFLAEAEITGGLEHPGVVPVYGLGRFGDGRPYYAMRFIQGDSLKDAIRRFHGTEWKKEKPGERQLALRGLLDRFVDVCNAVAYAHSRGVIHRDLKPANVMLGPYGETLLVDWGLAKALSLGEGRTAPPQGFLRPSSGQAIVTQAGAVVGTPEYMAPEQASGGALGPPADVFGLGATLYHLLTGRSPFGGPDLMDVLLHVVECNCPTAREVKPSTPSALSAICQKAMARQPLDRYSSARELAQDVERWLADEPVSAYPEPLLARLARWGRRHRPLVAGAAALLLTAVAALAVGIVAVKREKDRTEEARQRTRAALDEMSSQVIEDWLSRRGRLEPAQQQFLEKALAYYESFAAESGQTEGVRHSVADAHLRIGNIHYRLGQHGDAETAYRRAQELSASLAGDFPSAHQYRHQLAFSHLRLGNLLSNTGRPKDAEAAFLDALAIYQPLAAEYPTVPLYRQELANTQNDLGNLFYNTDRAKEAENAYREALAVYKPLVGEFPEVALYRQKMGGTFNNLAIVLEITNRPKDAEAAYRDALALYKPLAAEFPAVPAHRQQLASAYNNLGILLNGLGRTKEAEEAYRDALAINKPLAADFPTVPQYRLDLASSHDNLGSLLSNTGRPKEAEAAYGEALAIQKGLATDFPRVPQYQVELANTMNGLGELLAARKDHLAARQLLEQAQPPLKTALDANSNNPFARDVFCKNRQLLAATLLDLGDHANAAKAAAELARVAAEPANDAYKAACFLSRCVPLAEKDSTLPLVQRQELATSYGKRSLEALREALAKGYKDIAHLQKDKDLDPLRQRDDFQKLLADLDKNKPESNRADK
jgi:serine/threonine-protein kinase